LTNHKFFDILQLLGISKGYKQQKSKNGELLQMGEKLHINNAEQAEQQKEIPISEFPYRKVAKEAIMSWNGATEEEASAAVENQSYDELESQCYATGSMESGIKGILTYLKEQGISTDDIDIDKLHGDVFGPTDATEKTALQTGALAALGEKIKNVEKPEALVVAALSTIHDDWSRSNAKKFFQEKRNKEHQHMPIELIGWKEAKADLLFLRPILESAGVELNDDELQLSYYDRVSAFQDEHKVHTTEEIAAAIQGGADFYPALEGQTEIINYLSTQEGAAKVANRIAEKGIGSDTDYQAYLETKAEMGRE
jgi:hypothetical protein